MAQLVSGLRRAGVWRRLPPVWRSPVLRDPVGEPPWRRALAATGDARVADQLAGGWDDLPPDVQQAVVDPVGELGRAGRQATQRTCGPASLTMLAAVGDPTLALWLASGRLVAGHRPRQLAGADDAVLGRLGRASQATRFAALHRVVHRRATARAVAGLWPWPLALGTPPWALAAAARFPGVRYAHAVVDDTDARGLAEVLDRVRAAVTAGVPVPLLTGGDTGRGWATAVPRHVVLAVGAREDGLEVWEPARGDVVQAGPDALRGGTGHPAFGGWGHLAWAVLPIGGM